MTRPSETVNIIEAGEHGAESFGPLFIAEVSLWKAWNLIEETERERANFHVPIEISRWRVVPRLVPLLIRDVLLCIFIFFRKHSGILIFIVENISRSNPSSKIKVLLFFSYTLFDKLVGIYDILIDLFKKPILRDSNWQLTQLPISGRKIPINQPKPTREPFTPHIWLSTTPPSFFSKTKKQNPPLKKE